MLVEVASVAEMLALGEALGRSLAAGDILGLVGTLGAGKTVFVQGLARGLGVPPAAPVTSPTFTLVQTYLGGRLTLHHVDLYRLEREAELEHVGLDDLYRQEEDAVVAVEWIDRFPAAAPPDWLELRFDVVSTTARRLAVTAHGAASAFLLSHLQGARSS